MIVNNDVNRGGAANQVQANVAPNGNDRNWKAPGSQASKEERSSSFIYYTQHTSTRNADSGCCARDECRKR